MIFRILEDQYAEKSKVSKAADQRFMQLALTLGRRGQGRTWPNPADGRSPAAGLTPNPRRWRALAMLRAAPRSM